MLLSININLFAQPPTIEETQKYIEEIFDNKEKNIPYKEYYGADHYTTIMNIKFNGVCKGVISINKVLERKGKYLYSYTSGKFNLVDMHEFMIEEKYFKVMGRKGMKNLEVVNTGLKKEIKITIDMYKTYPREIETWTGLVNESTFSDFYRQKIEKAIKHLNTECAKLSKAKKELF